MTIIQNSLYSAPAPQSARESAVPQRGTPVAPANADLVACTCQRQDASEPAATLWSFTRALSAAKKRRQRLTASEAGMATAEYAIATLAAVGFAGLLVFILRSDEVRGFLLTLIRTALALP